MHIGSICLQVESYTEATSTSVNNPPTVVALQNVRITRVKGYVEKLSRPDRDDQDQVAMGTSMTTQTEDTDTDSDEDDEPIEVGGEGIGVLVCKY